MREQELTTTSAPQLDTPRPDDDDNDDESDGGTGVEDMTSQPVSYRFVPALLSLFIAILYLDVFTLKGLRLFVRRADPATWRGFEHPYIVHRVYGVALAAPYLANVYLLARSSGLLGRAARDARRERTRIGLLYEKYFGYEGSHFVWKVFCFQIVEVELQAAGKIPLFNTYLEDEEGESEEITKIDEEAIKEQISKLSTLRKERGDVSKYIQKIEEIASTDENLMPHIIKAVSEKVTIGEICNSLRKIWGEYRPKDIL